jgi:hypothetical protein
MKGAIDLLVSRVKAMLPLVRIETIDTFMQNASGVRFMAEYGGETLICTSKYYDNHHRMTVEEIETEARFIANFIAGNLGRKMLLRKEE